jgi:hypothetical protein
MSLPAFLVLAAGWWRSVKVLKEGQHGGPFLRFRLAMLAAFSLCLAARFSLTDSWLLVPAFLLLLATALSWCVAETVRLLTVQSGDA